MATVIGALLGGFFAAIFLPLFLFYFAGRQGRSSRAAITLRSLGVFCSVLVAIANSEGIGGQFPVGAALAVVVCVLWAVLATLRSDTGKALNGWQRLGVIPTVIWILWGLVFWRGWYMGLQFRQADQLFTACMRDLDPSQTPFSFCEVPYKASYEATLNGTPWWIAPIVAFLPVLAAWVLAWLCVRLFRWVRAGFAPARGA